MFHNFGTLFKLIKICYCFSISEVVICRQHLLTKLLLREIFKNSLTHLIPAAIFLSTGNYSFFYKNAQLLQ